MTYVKLPWQEQREVQVKYRDGRWYPGWLEAYRRDRDGWHGYVSYTKAPSATYLGWFEEGRIRGAGPG